MRALPLKYLTAEIRISAATSISIVAALTFFEGLAALADILSGMAQLHVVFRLSIFGLIAGPGLLFGSRLSYWYALVDMTLNAILCTAFLTFIAGMWWFGFSAVGASSAVNTPVLITAVLLLIPLMLWAVRALRNPEVRFKFGA